MIHLQCNVCPSKVALGFSYSVSFGLFVKLPQPWLVDSDKQQVFCSLKCAVEQSKKELNVGPDSKS